MQNQPVHSLLQAVLPHGFLVESEGPGSADPLPDVPIMASTRLQLELLLQEPVLDLRALTEVVLEDVGATLQILRLIGEEFVVEEERPMRIEDCLASLNTETWFKAVCASTVSHDSRMLDAWEHARRIGHYAEQLAANQDGVLPGEAHLVGLLHEVGKLPELLGWQSAAQGLEAGALGMVLAEHWHLPSCVVAATREQQPFGDNPLWSGIIRAAHARLRAHS